MKDAFPKIDELMKLAQTDPEALERLRAREIEALIDKAPDHLKNRLRGLQFQVDCKRRIHSSPIGACVAVSQMMMESMEKLQRALHGGYPMTMNGEPRSTAADIIRFPGKARSKCAP